MPNISMSTAAKANWAVLPTFCLINVVTGLLQLVRLTQVAVQQPHDELVVLHVERLVEAEVVADYGDPLRRGVLARQQLRRVARHGEQDDEGDDGDADEDDDELEEPSHDVGKHDAYSTSASPVGDKRAAPALAADKNVGGLPPLRAAGRRHDVPGSSAYAQAYADRSPT